MAEFTANASQSVAVNGHVLFTDTPVKPCQMVSHRDGSGLFTFRGGKKYRISFNANVSGATADTEVDLAFSINGETVLATQMASTPGSANASNNVACTWELVVPGCCCYTVSISNVGTTAVTVANANMVSEVVA